MRVERNIRVAPSALQGDCFCPLRGFFLITWLIIYYGCGRNKRKATYVSMDITTLFLIGSVAYMSRNLFGSGMLLWTIILFFLIAAGLLGNLQNRIKGRIDLVKIVRTLGRLGFFCCLEPAMFCCYFSASASI